MTEHQFMRAAGFGFGAIGSALLIAAAELPYRAWWAEAILILVALPFILSAAWCFILADGLGYPRGQFESLRNESERSGDPVITVIDGPIDWEHSKWA